MNWKNQAISVNGSRLVTKVSWTRQKYFLLGEFIILFGGIPLLILYLRERALMIAALWAGALLIHFFLKKKNRENPVEKLNLAGFRKGALWILLRFAILAPLIVLLTFWLRPDTFLSLPRERPELWVRIMILYPLLSVWPQELIYRAFFYHRYTPLFGQGRLYTVMSATMFGYMHILFLNWVAVAMTFIGGLLFASDYRRNRSLALVCLEHSLYGCLIFTVGLGLYFYTGAAWGSP